MTNPLMDGEALAALPTRRTELETALDETLELLRKTLKMSRDAARNDAIQSKAVQVASLALQVQRCCTVSCRRKQFDALQPSHNASEQWAAATPSRDAASQPSVWSGFYNKTLRERLDVLALMYPRLKHLKLQQAGVGDPAADMLLPSGPAAKLGELPLRTANLMIENCIGVLGLPLG